MTPDDSQPFRILAVDDELHMLKLYGEVLSSDKSGTGSTTTAHSTDSGGNGDCGQGNCGFDVTLCRDSQGAVDEVRSAVKQDKPYSVAFIDIRMEAGGDGLWAAEQIRKLDSNIEIVIASAFSDIGLHELNQRVPPPGKLLYIRKPFQPLELHQLAMSLCYKWQAEKRLYELNTSLMDLVEARTTSLREATEQLYLANEQLKRDIYERMRMHQVLRSSEERYRLLFEEDITGNFVADSDGEIQACNREFARILGADSIESAKRVNALSLEFESPQRESVGRMIRESKRVKNLEAVYRRHDHRTVFVIVNLIALENEEGGLKEVHGFLFDITEQKRLEEQLRQAQKMEAIGTLAGGIAHDFNNILGVIMGYAEIVQSGATENSPLKRRMEEILGACSRGRGLVNQILNFSRQGMDEKKPLSLTPLLKETVKMLRPTLPPNIEIRTNLLTASDTVIADPSQIHQIIVNLCSNAVHAMRKRGGVLEVTLAHVNLTEKEAAEHSDLSEGPYVRLTVSDEGDGIDAKLLERIFDPFFTTKKPDEGTGMGLSVVHGNVKRHHGVILVESKPGKGTTFQVFLPMIESLSGTELDTEPALLLPGRGKVLFVDDEKALVDMTGVILESIGFEVVSRTSSIEALEAFRHRAEEFDLVITDHTMPNMSGIDLAREIQRIRPDIPIILSTGFSEVISYQKAQSGGIRDMIMKPILKRNLIESINRVMGRRA